MIQFSCPKCDADLEAASDEGGTKVACPECGQRLVVPSAKPVKKSPAVTAKRPEPKAAPKAAPLKKAAPPKPKRRRDEDEDDEEEVVSRGKKGSSKTLWIILGVGGGLAACVAGVVVLILMRGDKTKESGAGGSTAPVMAGGGGLRPQGGPVFTEGGRPTPPVGNTGGAGTTPPTTGTPDKQEEPQPGQRNTNASGQRIYQYLLKSTVLILHAETGPQGQMGISMGSGSVIDKTNRLILTNYHVVGESSSVYVFFPTYRNGKLIAEQEYFFTQMQNPSDILSGKVLIRDKTVDLALVQLPRLPDDARALPFCSTPPGPAQPVYSVGHPGRSGGLWVYTEGKVRQLIHKKWQAAGHGGILNLEAEVVLTDSPTNQGDSGGPLVNGRGELVAVTQGLDPASQLMSIFINVSEVRGLCDRYAKSSGTTLALATTADLGPEVASDVPGLIRSLKDKDPKQRTAAVQALGDMGANAKLAVRSLIEAARDTDDLVRRLALEALAKIGPPAKSDLSLLVEALKDSSAEIRLYAVDSLGRLGPDARGAIPALVEAAKSPDSALRQGAARALGKMGPDSKEAVLPPLMEALNDKDTEVRRAAGESLASLPLAASDLPVLLTLLDNKEPDIRASAAKAIGQIGPDARTAVKPLMAKVADTSRPVRRAVLDALGQIGPDAKDAVADMEKAARDSDRDVRRSAIEALGKIGPEAKPAAPAIAKAVDDLELRKAAVAALLKIGPAAAKDAAPALAQILKANAKEDRVLALDALATLKPGATEMKDVVPKVFLVFEEKDTDLRDKAVETLAKFGKPAVNELIKGVGDTSANVRWGAVTALGEMGADAKGAATALGVHARGDTDQRVKDACIKALAKIQR